MHRAATISVIAVSLCLLPLGVAGASDTKPNDPAVPPTTAQAPVEQTNQASPGGNASTASSKDDPVICKRADAQTGSRVGPRKVCRKKSEWRAIQEGSRETLEGVQRAGTDLKGE
jgi:hypothetical protein